MKKTLSAFSVLTLGAAAMYLFDPQQGRRRREMLADRIETASQDTKRYLQRQCSQSSARAKEMVSRLREKVLAVPANDEQMQARVQVCIARAVSFPDAIQASAQGGKIVLRGDVLEREFNVLMSEIWAIPGVKGVDSQLAMHAEAKETENFSGEPHRVRRPASRHLARDAAAALAIGGGVGASLGAIRASSAAHLGLLSIAAGLLYYGLGGRILVQRPATLSRSLPAIVKRPHARCGGGAYLAFLFLTALRLSGESVFLVQPGIEVRRG